MARSAKRRRRNRDSNGADAERWIKVARTLKAVAHPLRLRILDLLEGGERSVGEIVKALGAKPAITSQQLGLMRDRGVLAARRDGPHVYYRIANRHVVRVVHCIRASCEQTSLRGQGQEDV